MKRDMNLVVKILEYCETKEKEICDIYFENIPDRYCIEEIFTTTGNILREHVRLAAEAGLVEIRIETEMAMNLRLKNNGYDFLETVRKVPTPKWREICQSGFASSVEVVKGIITGIATELGVNYFTQN